MNNNWNRKNNTKKRNIQQAFWIYQLGCELSNSYERLQSLVFCASMIPAIKKLYADDEEQQREALKRHLNFLILKEQ